MLENKKVKVVYIAGSGRSGSTLLEKILGLHPDIFAAGELRYIWDRSFLENQLCSCGKPFYKCDFWNYVIKSMNIKRDAVYIENIIKENRKIDRIRYIFIYPFLLNRIRNFCSRVKSLYESIYYNSGKKIIVDSSKHVSYLYLLSMCDFIDLKIIHILREPKAVAYAWQKKKVRPEFTNKIEYMPQFSVVRSSVDWIVQNMLIYNLGRKNKRNYFKLLYEDFVKNPKREIRNILKFLELNEAAIEDTFLSDRKVFLREIHSVAGNPMRFKRGEVEIFVDEEWKFKFPLAKKLCVDLITFPFKKLLMRRE